MIEAATADISSPSSQQTVKADDRDTQRIFRIPNYMRRSEKRTVESFYVPQLVSLGPFHYGQPGLANYESFKEKLPVDTYAFNNLVDSMVKSDSNIRQWYGLDSVRDDKERKLGSIMARDGLFLMEFLRNLYSNCKASGHISHSSTGDILSTPHPFAVKEDIMKLENQIPVFALDVISEWETTACRKPDSERAEDLNSILTYAFNTLSPFRCTYIRENLPLLASRDRHLLELVYENIVLFPNFTGNTEHCSYDSSFNQKSKRKRDITLPRAVELKRRGVKFSPYDGLLGKIRFDDGNCTIYLPRIELDGRTEAVLRNLLAFEEFVHKEKTKEKPLSCYVDLMVRLINTAEDVELLKHVGIICSDLGSDEEVARLFNVLAKILQKGKYKPIDTAIEKAIKFCTNKHRIWWAEFKKKGCPISLALIIGIISVFLSVYQTILSSQQVSLQIQSMKCV